MSSRPILSVTFKLRETTYSVLSVWPGRYPGTYSVTRDRGTEKRPSISLIDVIKAFTNGEGFVNVRVHESRSQGGESGGFEDAASFSDDVPF